MENFYENFMLAFWRETVTAVYRRISDYLNIFIPFDRLLFLDNTI
jgi:hypothetical protein